MRPRIVESRRLVLPVLLCLLAIPAGAAEHFVNTNGLVFEPANLVIQVGDTVTWVNADNGLHNVVADDGSFTSGAPSTDSWEYSYTFHVGGTYGYSCEVHEAQGMVGTVTVEGVFGDSYESGNMEAWSDNSTPELPACHCYFSGDCADAEDFCNWGVLTSEDNCQWKENKPNGVPGAGCDVEFPGVVWVSGICDGICTPFRQGSDLGREDQNLLIRGIQIWAEALLRPAESGGGPVDPELSRRAQELPFRGELSSWILGRQIGDLLASAGVEGIDEQYCYHESHPGEDQPVTPDLSNDACRKASGRLTIEALVAEISGENSAAAILDELRTICADGAWESLFIHRCAAGPEALACFSQRVAAAAQFLSTPPAN